MNAIIIDGKKAADKIKKSLKREISALSRKGGTLKLVALQVGRNPSSGIYAKAQMKLASEIGVKYHIRTLPAGTSQKKAEREIDKLNKNRAVTGIIIQAPAPKHINLARLFAKIAPDKDAEGLSPVNMGRLTYGDWAVAPCTASACMTLIDSTGVNLRGKEVVIVGHSEIVGKPLSLMLLSRMATTTVCHIGTYEKGMLGGHLRRAQVLVVSVGKSHLIKASWIRRGAIVIDVGINRHKGKITGDVDFNRAVKKAAYITPVPGGVGPVTTIMLMKNLAALCKMQRCKK
jgi:methylenetetrahydrofolate dehydrogenase (NADP+)/methenyltetrahydrofolate cyclohydrolase